MRRRNDIVTVYGPRFHHLPADRQLIEILAEQTARDCQLIVRAQQPGVSLDGVAGDTGPLGTLRTGQRVQFYLNAPPRDRLAQGALVVELAIYGRAVF
jgi:hypothetical protein